MAIFYPPPQPQQPTPHIVQETAAAAADNPPFGHQLRAAACLTIVLTAWAPPPPQPQQRISLPVAVTAVPEDNPPFSYSAQKAQALAYVIALWQPTPPTSWLERWATRHVPVSVSAVPEENPPFGIPLPAFPHIRRAWQPGPPQPPRAGPLPAALTAVPENSPPFGLKQPLWPILQAWQPEPPTTWTERWATRHLPVDVTAVPENLPPFGIPTPSLPHILRSWQPGPPHPPRSGPLPADITAVPEDQPPLGIPLSTLPTIIRAWQPFPAPLWFSRFLPQEAVAAADDPAFSSPSRQAWILAQIVAAWQPEPPTSWVERWATRHVPVDVSAVPEDTPPFSHRGRDPLPSILTQWQPGPPQPQIGPPFPQEGPIVGVDNPPFGIPQPSVFIILRAWQPDPFPSWTERWTTRHLPIAVTAVAEDIPPFGIPQPSLSHILRAWQPGPPLPPRSGPLPASIAAVAEDQPPFSHGARNHLSVVLRSWEPAPPQPQVNWKVPPAVEAVPEENPPFSGIGRNPLPNILMTWQPDLGPQRQQGAHVPPSVSAVPEDNPPFGVPPVTIFHILQSWQILTPPIQKRNLLAQEAVSENPPFGVPSPSLVHIVQSWQPVPPPTWTERWSTRALPSALTAVPVDLPPFTQRGRDPLSLILALWQPDPGPQRQHQRVTFVSESIVSPPMAVRTGDSVIIHHGRPATQAPRQAPPREFPLVPQPSLPPRQLRQPQAFFERGVTALSLFITSKTTLHIREQIQEQITALDTLVAGVPLVTEGRTSSVEISVDVLRQTLITHDRTTIPLLFIESGTAISARLPQSEQIHTHIALHTIGRESGVMHETGCISVALHEAQHMIWELAETHAQSLPFCIEGSEGDEWDIPHAALMEAIALVVVHVIEEDSYND